MINDRDIKETREEEDFDYEADRAAQLDEDWLEWGDIQYDESRLEDE